MFMKLLKKNKIDSRRFIWMRFSSLENYKSKLPKSLITENLKKFSNFWRKKMIYISIKYFWPIKIKK